VVFAVTCRLAVTTVLAESESGLVHGMQNPYVAFLVQARKAPLEFGIPAGTYWVAGVRTGSAYIPGDTPWPEKVGRKFAFSNVSYVLFLSHHYLTSFLSYHLQRSVPQFTPAIVARVTYVLGPSPCPNFLASVVVTVWCSCLSGFKFYLTGTTYSARSISSYILSKQDLLIEL
jgi:hypothetical protein